MDDYERDGESKAARLDRNWVELLQEVRVSETGVQILTGFLLTLPLQARFGELNDFVRGTYVAALTASILSTILFIAPVSMHRLLFRQGLKETAVRAGDELAKAGLVFLALAISCVVTLVFAVLFGDLTGQLAGGVSLLLFLAAWVVLPLALRRAARLR